MNPALMICERCGHETVSLHCKIICRNCGAFLDCTDLEIPGGAIEEPKHPEPEKPDYHWIREEEEHEQRRDPC